MAESKTIDNDNFFYLPKNFGTFNEYYRWLNDKFTLPKNLNVIFRYYVEKEGVKYNYQISIQYLKAKCFEEIME